MPKLARCPLCGGKAVRYSRKGKAVWCSRVEDGLCDYNVTMFPALWNRLARLVRKGRMWEWVCRHYPGLWGNLKRAAADWWRRRKPDA